MSDIITHRQEQEIETLKSLPIDQWANQFAEWDFEFDGPDFPEEISAHDEDRAMNAYESQFGW